MKASILRQGIEAGKYDLNLLRLYDQKDLEHHKGRYVTAINQFVTLHDDLDVTVFSVPGRSEVGGNHTDHQHGKVIAAAITLDMIAVVAKNDSVVDVVSDDYVIEGIDVNVLDIIEQDKGTSKALVRGVLAKYKELGFCIGGFCGYFTSDVLMGSGLSSSAAFEVMIGTILSGLYNEMKIDPVVIAKVGQYAENVYFGKPCGLMDQSACSVGGLIHIDFEDNERPVVTKLDVDFNDFKHRLCIVDTKGSHANLTDEYASIPNEIKRIANFFNQPYLRLVDETLFYSKLDDVRRHCGDRAVLRAIHVFEENKRVDLEKATLESNDFESFKKVFLASGDSSYKYLQNVFATSDIDNQGVSLGLCMSNQIIGSRGVVRVHGGGFAGTIQAFVEEEFVAEYKTAIEKVFGLGSCHVLNVRDHGGVQVF